MTAWHGLRRSDFDAAEPLTLFEVEDIKPGADVLGRPDKSGSPSLFTTASEEK